MSGQSLAAAAKAAAGTRTSAEARVQRLLKQTQYHRRQGNTQVMVAVADLEALIVTAAVKLVVESEAA